MGRPTLPVKSPKRLQGARRRSANHRNGSSGSTSSLGSSSGSSGGVAANIKVAVRVRPENSREIAGNYANVVRVIDDKMLVFDPKEDQDDFYYQGKKNNQRDLNKKQKKDQKFAFDAVYGPDSTNDQVFAGTTKDLVETIFNGYNCSVFAYGATGAGKTFTMLGGGNQLGITFLTMQEIFNKVQALEEEKSCEVAISYLEVYNETVLDLLNPGAQLLNVRDDGKATSIPGLTLHKPQGPEAILELLKFGNGNRTQHATDANSESSRSHAVLQVFVRQKDKSAGLSAEVKVAKLSMIDLAGSEKGTVTAGKTALRSREGSNINKSLLALGSCINNLAEGAKYIPYRNSKLTRLLKDSIGGNCRTVMIANVSPSAETFEDTFNTLKYADRAKKIKISLKANVLNVNFHLGQYTKIVEDLRTEITALKERIAQLEAENEALGRQNTGVSRPRMESEEEMVVDSTEGTQAGMYEAKLAEMEDLQRTLNRYIERQRDYDDLQERLRVSNERLAAKEKMPNPKPQEAAADLITLQDPLMTKLNEHADKLKLLTTLKVRVANLTVRVHFKKQLQVRSDAVSITTKEKEKERDKSIKIVARLEKKLAREEESLAKLVLEAAASNQAVQDLVAEEDGQSWKSKYAKAELVRMEVEAQAKVDNSLVKTMGNKVETMDEDLNAALEMLRKDHMCCRGHDISTKEDKKAYDELKDKLLGHNVTWGGTEDDQGASGSLGTPGGSTREPPYFKYTEAARLNLPSLRAEHSEQAAYEAPDDVGQDTEVTESSRVQSISPEVVPGTPQPLRQVRGTPKLMVEGTPQLGRPSPKLPQVKVQDTTQFDTPSPQSMSNKEQEPDTTSPTFTVSTAKLSPTLHMSKSLTSSSSAASPALPTAGTSAAGALPPPAHSPSPKASLAASSISSPQSKPSTARQATPKRVSSPLSPSLESATKRRRTWRQEEEDDSDSEGTVGTLDSTYECISSIPPWKPMPEPVKEGMNDTMVLVEKLDNAGLDSPLPVKTSSSPTANRSPLIPTTPSSPSLRPAGANSTYAVSEELEMDVDQHLAVDPDHLLPQAASLDSAGLNDVSYIVPPKGPTRSIRSSSASPIKAGMGVRSPLFQRSPSPLRQFPQSTMLDLQPRERLTSGGGAGATGRPRTTTGGKRNSPSAIPRRSPRNEFAAPTPRMPGSSQKPKAGVTPSLSRGTRPSATTPQPQRKVLAKKTLKHSVSVGVLPQPTYMAATRSSKGRAGAVAGVASKENPVEALKSNKGIASTVSHRIDKLKKQISGTTALKPNNKN